MLLAIDGATDRAGVALFDGTETTELAWAAGRNQTVALLSQIHRLLELRGIGVGDLGAIAVSAGPGSFTGLRVGMSAAKGLVLALGVPLLGISTLDATALPALALGRSVVALVAAGRDRLVWAAYPASHGPPSPAAAARNGTAAELWAFLAARTDTPVVLGDWPFEEDDPLAVEGTVTLPPPPLRGRRVGSVAWLGWERHARGEADDAVLLEPRYNGR